MALIFKGTDVQEVWFNRVQVFSSAPESQNVHRVTEAGQNYRRVTESGTYRILE